jgi:UDP-N-acetylglucosamine 1-carboxyvinyltransferase
MSTLLIEGGHRLEGRVAVEGNKNAALPLLAACLLTDEECVLTNVPRIGDVEVMARLLLDVGAEVEGIGGTTLRVRAPRLTTHAPDRSLVQRLRGSVLLLGPLLARLVATFRRGARSRRTSRRCCRWVLEKWAVSTTFSKRPTVSSRRRCISTKPR